MKRTRSFGSLAFWKSVKKSPPVADETHSLKEDKSVSSFWAGAMERGFTPDEAKEMLSDFSPNSALKPPSEECHCSLPSSRSSATAASSDSDPSNTEEMAMAQVAGERVARRSFSNS